MHRDNLLETIINLYPQEINYSWLLFHMFVCMLWLIGYYVLEEADEERRMAQSLEEQEQAAKVEDFGAGTFVFMDAPERFCSVIDHRLGLFWVLGFSQNCRSTSRIRGKH